MFAVRGMACVSRTLSHQKIFWLPNVLKRQVSNEANHQKVPPNNVSSDGLEGGSRPSNKDSNAVKDVPFVEPLSIYETEEPKHSSPADLQSNSVLKWSDSRTLGDEAWRTYSPFYEDQAEHDSKGVRQVSTALTLRQLMAAGLHLGHASDNWNAEMLPYIYGKRHNIYIINLEHTLVALRRAIQVVRQVAVRKGYILFVGTKPAIQKIAVDAARRCHPVGYFVTDWKRGTITNKDRVLRKSVGHDPEKIGQKRVEITHGAPRDASASNGAQKLSETVLRDTPRAKQPDLLVFLDPPNLTYATNEANLANIPIIALCDTNVNPNHFQYPIPGNDDSLPGVELVAGALSMAAREGLEARSHLFRRHAFNKANRPVKANLDAESL